jgi:YD repeat-containing protein
MKIVASEHAANPDGKRLTSTYDAARQRTRLVTPGGGRTTYSYDAASRLTRVINPQGERTTLLYDAAGRQTRTTLGNSTSTSSTYDGTGRTTRVFHRKSAGTLILATTYTYDKADNRTGFKESDGDRVTYLYDKTNQLTGRVAGATLGLKQHSGVHTCLSVPKNRRSLAPANGEKMLHRDETSKNGPSVMKSDVGWGSSTHPSRPVAGPLLSSSSFASDPIFNDHYFRATLTGMTAPVLWQSNSSIQASPAQATPTSKHPCTLAPRNHTFPAFQTNPAREIGTCAPDRQCQSEEPSVSAQPLSSLWTTFATCSFTI